MHLPKLWPRDWDHLAGGVQLHGATAESNHAAIECKVFGLQLVHVTENQTKRQQEIKTHHEMRTAASRVRCDTS